MGVAACAEGAVAERFMVHKYTALTPSEALSNIAK